MIASVALLTFAGLLRQRHERLSAVECLLLPYFSLMLLWPLGTGIRYTLPLVPWIVFLALRGLRELTAHTHFGYSAAAPWGLLLIIAIPFSQAYHTTDFGPIRENTGLPEFDELCETVRRTTRSDDVFIYYRARALSLYTGRPASTYNRNGTQAELWEWSTKVGARYLITTDAFIGDGGFLTRFSSAYPDRLDLSYQNPHFSLYRIRPAAAPATASLSH